MAKEKIKKPSKNNPLASQAKVWEILKKEYTFENWLLAILAPILMLYGVYIILGKFGYDVKNGTQYLFQAPSLNLGSSSYAFINFFFNTDLKRILTGSVLLALGLGVLIYVFIPYLKPSIVEMKKVSWPTSKQLASNTARVFSFLVFLMIVFTIYQFIIDPIFKLLY